MKYLILILFLFALFLNSCKNDNSSIPDVKKNEDISLDNIKNSLLKKDTVQIKENSIDSSGIIVKPKTSNTPSIHETEKVKKQKLKLAEKKAKVIVQKIKESSYKELNCEKMIVKYKNIIEEYKKTKNEELLLWKDTNDPIYKFCYEKHTAVFDSLERIENSLFEDEQY